MNAKNKEILVTGFALFAMFLGAGNRSEEHTSELQSR